MFRIYKYLMEFDIHTYYSFIYLVALSFIHITYILVLVLMA